MTPTKTLILVDDDPGHVTLILRNLYRIRETMNIVVKDSGQSAVQYVQEKPKMSGLVMLLDLNMPELSGFEVLKILKEDTNTRHVPIFVLSSTDNQAEINRCYELGCNGYFMKPVDYGAFAATVQSFANMLSWMLL